MFFPFSRPKYLWHHSESDKAINLIITKLVMTESNLGMYLSPLVGDKEP
jgi:hypothetical protein